MVGHSNKLGFQLEVWGIMIISVGEGLKYLNYCIQLLGYAVGIPHYKTSLFLIIWFPITSYLLCFRDMGDFSAPFVYMSILHAFLLFHDWIWFEGFCEFLVVFNFRQFVALLSIFCCSFPFERLGEIQTHYTVLQGY